MKKKGSEATRDADGPSDRVLVDACRKGDAAAWEQLIRRYQRLIYSIPSAYRLPREVADDIFQQVALALFEHVETIRDPDRIGAWLAVSARRACWAWSRGDRKTDGFAEGEEESLPDEPPDVAGQLHQIDCEHVLQLSLSKLGEPCRGLLTALYVEEPRPSYEELAVRLDRPIGSLGPTRARCLKKLERLYRQAGGPEPDFG
jgi:RNA polymerase sigma factor (sigma-70 family)